MSAKHESMNALLRLYELRREETMRKARHWFTTEFNPESVQDIFNVMVGEHSADYRMVTTYWDMAAAFVNHGCIDEQLFHDVNTEYIAVFAKVEPFLAEFRATVGVAYYLTHLEQLVMRMPDAQERIAVMRRFMKRRMAAQSEAAKAARAIESPL